jgi:tRNA (guanine6-N2)-methyltransferase
MRPVEQRATARMHRPSGLPKARGGRSEASNKSLTEHSHSINSARARDTDAAPSFRFGPNIYLAQTQPGFEGVAWEEIAASVNNPAEAHDLRQPLVIRELGRRSVRDRAGITIFSTTRPEALGLLRTVEDVFAVVGYRHGLIDDPTALERIAAIARQSPYVEHALALRTRLTRGSRSGRRLRYRVIARMAGEHQFRRVDLARAVSRGIAERGDHSWRLSSDEADVEFWATLLPGEVILAIRLSDERMRHRDYKVAHLPGSLRPSVAAALALLSKPMPGEVVLDPFCGAATVLIERACLERYRLLIGCDRDPEALAAARENVGPRYKPLELHRWDAAALPLPNRSIAKIITNLPWGLRHGSHEVNRRLYPRILQEFHRLLQPAGRIVILTGETHLMSELISRGLFRPQKILRVSILGASAAVYVSGASS